MIAFLLKLSAKLLLFSALLYGTFFVSVGNRTVYEHMKRIVATQEARELGTGLESAALHLKDQVKSAVGGLPLGNRLEHK
jgi:hypothetical protein